MEVRVGRTVIHYELEGPADAPVVALSHSLAAALELWDWQVPALRGSYRVLRFDTRGHGRSSAPRGPYTMEMLSEDVIGLLDRLRIRRTHFVGISMGGMIGQVLALNYPERLEKLVLCDTTDRVPPELAQTWKERIRVAETDGMEALAQETLERWFSGDFLRNQPETAGRIRDMILRTPVPGYIGCRRAINDFDVSRDLSRVTAPTLVVVGQRDPVTPVSAAEAIADKIGGSEMVVLPGALHLPNIEAADLFNRALLRFLR